MAFGGANAVLSTKLRFASASASASSALLFVAASYVVLTREALFGVIGKSTIVHVAIWLFAGVFGISAVANTASHSRWERFLMAPIGAVLAASCVVLALSS